MLRHPDSLFGYWLSRDKGLSGYPSRIADSSSTASPAFAPLDVGEAVAERIARPASIQMRDLIWQLDADASLPAVARLISRDALGFRYERIVGLEDYVSRAEAAQVLGLSLMTIGRWIRAKKLPEKKRSRHGKKYSVVKVADLWRLAIQLKLRVPTGRLLAIVAGTADGTLEEDTPQKEE